MRRREGICEEGPSSPTCDCRLQKQVYSICHRTAGSSTSLTRPHSADIPFGRIVASWTSLFGRAGLGVPLLTVASAQATTETRSSIHWLKSQP